MEEDDRFPKSVLIAVGVRPVAAHNDDHEDENEDEDREKEDLDQEEEDKEDDRFQFLCSMSTYVWLLLRMMIMRMTRKIVMRVKITKMTTMVIMRVIRRRIDCTNKSGCHCQDG